MNRLAAIGLLACVAATHQLTADQRLAIRVSPVVALAPALVTVRASVEPNDANRVLQITVCSSSYLRTSEIPLDGKNALRVNVIELKEVPTGLYEVRATLRGAAGPLATAMQLVKVQPAPGYSH